MDKNRLALPPLRLLLASATLMMMGAGCADTPGGAAAPVPIERMQVVLDYSPTLSDAGALLYLASDPSVELLAVTLPGTGEADCAPGTRTTRALLAVAGQPEVPVGCGRDEPLEGDRDWPAEWRAEVNRWGAETLPPVPEQAVGDAEQLLVDTLSAATEPITVVAVGPLTNLGAVLTAHPALADRIARIVVMGGAVTVAGNVEASPAAEWNIYIDPAAARAVIDAGVEVTFVALDATNHVPWTERLLSRLGSLGTPAADTVHALASSRASLAGFYLWDELAAMAAVTPGLVTVAAMTVRIDDDGAIVRDPAGVVVDIAVDADPTRATEEFVRVLNGGTSPDAVALTAAERAYFMAMNAADSRANTALAAAFAHVEPDPVDPRAVAASIVEAQLAAAAALADDLREITPPASLRAAHDRYLDSVTRVAQGMEQVLAAVAASDGEDVDAVMNDAMTTSGLDTVFADLRSTCQALEDYSFTRGGPRPCSAAVDR